MTTSTWKDAEAEAIEVRADILRGIGLAIEQADGMLPSGSELASQLQTSLTLSRIEESNLRSHAARLRGVERDAVPVAA